MTTTTHIRGPQISAVALFRKVAPTYAKELARQLYDQGLRNSDDVITAMTTGLRSFANDLGVDLAREFPKAWPEALRVLRPVQSEQEWEHFLRQTASAPRAKSHKLAWGAAQTMDVLGAARKTADMSPLVITAFGIWIITAVVIAHSGPLDADISLEDLAECL